MKLKLIAQLLVAGIGIVSLGVAGCAAPPNLEAVAPEQTTTAQPSPSQDQAQTNPSPVTEAPTREPDVIYVPTPVPVVNEMLRLASKAKNSSFKSAMPKNLIAIETEFKSN